VVLQNYKNLEKEVRGTFGETSCDADQTMNIKTEEVSDAEEEEEEEEEDPVPITFSVKEEEEEEEETVPITFSEIKVEPEVSCMSLYAHCQAGITNMQKCQLSLSSPSVCEHETTPLCC
jgi:hypothetical protein